MSILEIPIPHDCTDGFQGAYWRRPRASLSASVRVGVEQSSLLSASR